MLYNTLGQRFKHATYLVKNKPKKLMWLIFLGVIASVLVSTWCGDLNIIALPISLGLSAGICLIALNTVRNEDSSPKDLFAAFKDLKTAKRVIGGQLWTYLILMIWMVVPAVSLYVMAMWLMGTVGMDIHMSGFSINSIDIEDLLRSVGMMDAMSAVIFMLAVVVVLWVFLIIMMVKAFEYIFTPFILMTREDVSPFDAWKESKRLTYGIKGRIFGFVALPALLFGIVSGILFGLAHIPVLGSLFLIALTVLLLFGIVFLPYFYTVGLAGFYEASLHAPTVQYAQPMSAPATMPTYAPAPEPVPAPEPAPDPEPTPAPAPAPEPSPDADKPAE